VQEVDGQLGRRHRAQASDTARRRTDGPLIYRGHGAGRRGSGRDAHPLAV